MPAPKAFEILLVEDNPADVRLTQEALRDAKVHNHLSVVGDGEQALAFLRRQPPFTDAPCPHLVLLDLNLPRLDGPGVLRALKSDPQHRHIPILILTSSEAEADIRQAYDLQANCYIIKPVDLDDFIKVVHFIESFWLETVRLPRARLA